MLAFLGARSYPKSLQLPPPCPPPHAGEGTEEGQPPQPPIVTLICRDAEKNVPSLSRATAMTSCVAASRMRVEASGTLMVEKRNRITRAFGFAGATTRISCT